MRSKVTDGSNFENRTLNRIYEIKEKMDANPNILFSNIGSPRSAIGSCCTVLKKINVIMQVGSKKKPEYRWNNKITINTRLANKVASLIREERRKQYPASKASNTALTQTEDIHDNMAVSVCFAMYTDQQLWDELKNRGYSVQDNQITKQTCLK